MQKVQIHNFSHSHKQANTIWARLTWSKNIAEEQEAPMQMLIGLMESRVCVLIALASYLEAYFELLTMASSRETFIFGSGLDGDRFARAVIGKIIGLAAFPLSADGGNLGTHSIQKGAATYALQNGVVKDHVNLRGRWRATTIVDCYISVLLPLPDSQVAGVLAGPKGPAIYKIKQNINTVTDHFLLTIVAPQISCVLGTGIGRVLGIALLYAALSNMEGMMPHILDRIWAAYISIGGNVDVNPVERVPVVIAAGPGGQVCIVKAMGHTMDNRGGSNDGGSNNGGNTRGQNGSPHKHSKLFGYFINANCGAAAA